MSKDRDKEKPSKPQVKILDRSSSTPKPRPFASVSLRIDPLKIEEGENPDATISLHNLTAHPAPHVIAPDVLGGAIAFCVKPIVSPSDAPQKPRGEQSSSSPISGTRFDLRADETRDFHIPLFNDVTRESVYWLTPGAYTIQAFYLSPLDERMGIMAYADYPIDWDTPMASNVVTLTVVAAPESKKKQLEEVRQFIQSYEHKPDVMRARYQTLLGMGLSESLEKRVRLCMAWHEYHAAGDNPNKKLLALDEVKALIRMKLTPGESVRSLSLLGRLYVDMKRWQEAQSVLRKVNTPYAQYYLEIAEEEIKRNRQEKHEQKTP